MTESNNNNQSVVSPSLTLEEYKETLAYLRHEDQLGWTILGLTFTAALGLWAYIFKDLAFFSGKSLALSGLGVIVLVLGRLMARRLTDYTKSLWKRAEELEETLGFLLLTQMRRRITKNGAPRINLMLDLIALGTLLVWFAYLVIFIWRVGI